MVLVGAMLLGAVLAASQEPLADAKPHIVFVLADGVCLPPFPQQCSNGMAILGVS
jgi:hypothetical protein